MTIIDALGGVGPATTLGATALGVLFVLRLVIRFQRDFTDRYADELRDLREQHGVEIVKIRERLTAAEEKLDRCERREAIYRGALISAGVGIPTEAYQQ